MKNITKQWITLGLAMGVSNEDLIGVFPNRGAVKQVTPMAPQPVIVVKHPFTAEEALRLHGLHRNWSTVARLTGKRKADVIAMVHAARPAPSPKVKEPVVKEPKGITVMEATKRALSSKKYLTMKEVVAAVRAQDTVVPVFSSTVGVYVNSLVRAGQAKRRHEAAQLTGYKLVG